MARKLHPADVEAAEFIQTKAVYFTVNLRHEGRNEMLELKTLPQAREAARLLPESLGSNRRALIYAVDANGYSRLVPDWYQLKPMGNSEMITQVQTLECAVPHGDVPAPAGRPAKRHVSRAYTDRSNCRKAAKKFAAEHGKTIDDCQINALGNGAFTFEIWLDAPAASPAAEGDGQPATEAVAADLSLPTDGSIPTFLNRIPTTPEEKAATDAAIQRAVAQDARKDIRMPKISNPKSRVSASAKALGMSPVAMRSAGAKSKATAKPEKAERKAKAAKAARTPAQGDRARYDLAKAEELVAKGKLPPEPDFSAETHKHYRGKLAEVTALAKAGDVKKLQAYPINPTSTSPRALDRYRNLCVQAIKNANK